MKTLTIHQQMNEKYGGISAILESSAKQAVCQCGSTSLNIVDASSAMTFLQCQACKDISIYE